MSDNFKIKIPNNENHSIPAIRMNAETGDIDIFMPVIKNAPGLASMVPTQITCIRHYSGNVLDCKDNKELVHVDDVTVSKGILPTASLVYSPELDLVIFKDTRLSAYNPNGRRLIEATEEHLYEYDRLCNQDYGESTANVGILYNKNTPLQSDINFIDSEGVKKLKDKTGILKRMSKMIDPERGLLFKFCHTFNELGRNVSFLWNHNVHSFFIVEDGELRSISVPFEMCIKVKGGYLLCKSKIKHVDGLQVRKYKFGYVSETALNEFTSGQENNFVKNIVKVNGTSKDIYGIVNVNGESRNLFALEYADEGHTLLVEFNPETLSFDIVKQYELAAIQQSFTTIEYQDNIYRIIFEKEE